MATKKAATVGKPPPPSKKASSQSSRKREHQDESSDEEEDSNRLFLVGYTEAEISKYKGMMKKDWTIQEVFSGSITHLVIKSMGSLKHSQQLLPIYYAVLKGIFVLRPSFLPHAVNRRKSLGGPTPLQDEAQHAYDGKEVDANCRSKSNFPSILDIVKLSEVVSNRAANRDPPILGSAPFQKVAILAGRSRDSKQRREELKLVMEAGGATVVEDTVFKTWKANNKKKKGEDIEIPTMVIIVNGETNMNAIGLDDETIRHILKARAPLFYEEFVTSIFLYMQPASCLDDLLLQSFVFIHETMKTVDPDGKLQALVLDGEDEAMIQGERTPSDRRPNSRVSSAVRESASNEPVSKETMKKGRRVKEEKEEEKEKVADPPKRGRPKKIDNKEEKEDEKMEEDEAPEGTTKEVKRGQAEKEVKKEEEEGEEMDVDPSLVDGSGSLLEEFEKEIEEKKKGGRKKEGDENMEKELTMRELEEMREERDDDDGDAKEEPVTPEPILFSQVATQPAIVIPEELKKALEVKEEESEASGKTEKDVVMDEVSSDDGSDTLVGEENEDIEHLKRMRESMNNEMGRGDWREGAGERSETGNELSSELGSVAPIVIEDAKECETCNHLGTSHLYINQQTAREIAQHFASPRLDWFDIIIDVKKQMPWIREGKELRPASEMSAGPLGRATLDLFMSFFHELNDETEASLLLSEVNSSDAMEMYESEWNENKPRRPPVALMIKMLHEFGVKCHAEDLGVPDRVCESIKRVLPAILPSSSYGRHYWLTVLAGGSCGIKGRAAQVIEEMAKRCKTFFIKAFLTDTFLPCIAELVTYFFEVDLLCAQTPVIDYDGKKKEEESLGSQRSTKAKNDKRKKNPLDNFPLVLLLVMDLNESPKRGLTESAVLMIQKLMLHVVMERRYQEWDHSATIKRALLCLLEAARWHCAQAASPTLTGAERRRAKAAESAGGSQKGPKVPLELQQNIQTAVRWIRKRGLPKAMVREMLCLGWLEDIVDAME